MYILIRYCAVGIMNALKGQLQGHTAIFKVWKWPLEQNFEEKNYTTLISIKNATNFVSTTFLYDDFFDRGQFQF